MRNFHGITFIKIRTNRDIFKSTLVYLWMNTVLLLYSHRNMFFSFYWKSGYPKYFCQLFFKKKEEG